MYYEQLFPICIYHIASVLNGGSTKQAMGRCFRTFWSRFFAFSDHVFSICPVLLNVIFKDYFEVIFSNLAQAST